jgi:hypothetical protein
MQAVAPRTSANTNTSTRFLRFFRDSPGGGVCGGSNSPVRVSVGIIAHCIRHNELAINDLTITL